MGSLKLARLKPLQLKVARLKAVGLKLASLNLDRAVAAADERRR